MSGRADMAHGSKSSVERLMGLGDETIGGAVADDLVGREKELAAVATAMAAVQRGVQRVVHLVGEPGIGKTSLAEGVATLASTRGWVVAWGRTWSTGAASPYWPWQQVLGSLFRTGTVADRCHRATLAWLVDLVPEVADLVESPSPSMDPDRARVALHRAVVHVLDAAAGDRRPLMVVLDDLHAADAASLELAALVARSLPNSPLLLLTTQRSAGSAADPAAPAWLGELNRQGTVLPIGPLDRDAVAAQAATLTGHAPTAGEVAELYRASGGNPFFVEQLARRSHGGPPFAAPGGLPVTAAVHHMVNERLAGLGVDGRRVVTVAAVAGDVVDEGVLATVAQLPPGRFADAVGEAVSAGILWRRSSEQPVCGFVHALLRESAAETVEVNLRRILHDELAGALAALPVRQDRLAEIANHRRAALPIGDPQAMVEATLAAAAAAARVFAHDATIAQCEAGLAAIGIYGAAPAARRLRARLLGVLGQAQADAGDPPRARQTLVEAHTLALDVGDVALAAEAAIQIPRITTFLVPDRELQSVLTVALQALGDADLRLRVRLLARRAVIAEDAADRQTHSEQAVRAARRLGDERLLAEVLSGQLFVLWAPDTTQERLDTSPEIIDLATRTRDVRRELDGRMWRLSALLEFGRVAEAEAELSCYEHLAERLAQPEFLFFARSRRCTLATLRGEFDDAERLTRDAHELAVQAGLPDARTVFVAQLAFIAWLRGGDLVDEVLALYTDMDMPPTVPAALLFNIGRHAQARALLPAVPSATAARLVPGPRRWFYFVVTAEVAHRLGDVEAAGRLYDDLTALADRFVVTGGATGCLGAAARLLGLCALTLDRPAEAVEWFRRAEANNRAAGAVPFVARAQTMLAVALRRRGGPGDADEARRLLLQAAGLAADLGMAPLTQEIAQLQDGNQESCDNRPRLRRDGEDWMLTFGGRSTRLRHSKGLAQLAVLLANPGQEVSAVDLAGGVDTPSRAPVLDDKAKRAYRHRLAELDQALQEADDRGDVQTAGRLAAERAALVTELKRATGLTGRSRTFSDEAERARVNVTRTIRQTLDRILTADPDTGRHLLESVHTGIHCSYQPDR